MQGLQPWRRSALTTLCGLWLLIGTAAAASRYTITLDPPTFNVDESAELTITISGDEDAVPIIPHIPGLVINPDGSSSSVQQINGGAVTAIFARTYRVTADHPGTYTVAPIQMGNATLRPLTVQVLPAGSVARGGAMGLPPSGSPRTEHVAPEPTTPAQIAAAVRAAMPIMKVVLPKTPIYAGQLVPIQIKGYFRDGTSARQTGPMTAAVDAFTVSGLDKPATQTLESLNGVTYRVLTWNSVLGALKSGSYPISIELPLVLDIELPGANSDMASRLRALFGTSSANAFMDDSAFGGLFGRVVQKAVTLKPDPAPVTVLPLPEEGKPADFTGAVGQFQVSSELAPKEGTVGDPLTFKFTVTGKGNLGRVNTDALHDLSQWRVYRADAKVTADDETGLQGYKTFSQPLVPLQAGQLTLPGVSFSYFDPEAQRYVTRTSPAIEVGVRPGTTPVTAAPGSTLAATPRAVPGDTLAPDAAVSAQGIASLEPLVSKRWFAVAAAATVLLMLALVTLIRRQQRRAADPALALHAARLAAVHINIEAMAAALTRGDAPAFFAAARHALQERLADLWQVPADSVDQQLVAARLPQEEGAELRAIFAMAEKASYARESPGVQALQEWQRRILTQMDRLEAVA